MMKRVMIALVLLHSGGSKSIYFLGNSRKMSHENMQPIEPDENFDLRRERRRQIIEDLQQKYRKMLEESYKIILCEKELGNFTLFCPYDSYETVVRKLIYLNELEGREGMSWIIMFRKRSREVLHWQETKKAEIKLLVAQINQLHEPI